MPRIHMYCIRYMSQTAGLTILTLTKNSKKCTGALDNGNGIQKEEKHPGTSIYVAFKYLKQRIPLVVNRQYCHKDKLKRYDLVSVESCILLLQ